MRDFFVLFSVTPKGDGCLRMESNKSINSDGILVLLGLTVLLLAFSMISMSTHIDQSAAARQHESAQIIRQRFSLATMAEEKHRLNVALPHVQTCIDSELSSLLAKQSNQVKGLGAKIAKQCMNTFMGPP